MPTNASSAEPILRARGIVKRFPGVLADDHVDLDLHPGEVLALLGENGAGKSTLMNVLNGLYAPDAGSIEFDGQPVQFASPRDAIARGIGMVHQHFMLIPPLTVAENIMLGDEPTVGPGIINLRQVHQNVLDVSRRYGLAVDPDAVVRNLPVGAQQRVEILKALYRQARLLILDEPTAVLTPQEANELFRVMRELAQAGTSIVFITHKLHEVFAVADRIVVMRNARVVGALRPADATPESLAALMVGRPVLLRVDKQPHAPGATVLDVQGLWVLSDLRTPAVEDVSLQVRTGEIVGIAGVQGNGQTELIEALSGLRQPTAGRILLEGRDVTEASAAQLIRAGVGHVPEDRLRHGLVLTYTVADNTVLRTYDRPPFAHGIAIVRQAILSFAQRLVREFDIRVRSVNSMARTLSGGNQQKVVLAREFARNVRLLLAAQPTRGVDVGSTEFVHRKLVEARDAGLAVLLVSAELDEVMSLSDRIAVMYRGRIVEILDASDATPEVLGLLMATGARSPVAPR